MLFRSESRINQWFDKNSQEIIEGLKTAGIDSEFGLDWWRNGGGYVAFDFDDYVAKASKFLKLDREALEESKKINLALIGIHKKIRAKHGVKSFIETIARFGE